MTKSSDDTNTLFNEQSILTMESNRSLENRSTHYHIQSLFRY